MMGNKKLSTIRQEIDAAFARAGKSPEETLQALLSELEGKTPAESRQAETLLLLRDALVAATRNETTEDPRTRRKKPKAV
jgi:hypothetical protein